MTLRRSVTIALGLATIAAVKTASAQNYTKPVTVNTDVATAASGSGVTVNLTGQGSGVNGPGTAQFGANLACTKDNWQTTSTVGEIDCVNIALHQGGPGSDGSGRPTA